RGRPAPAEANGRRVTVAAVRRLESRVVLRHGFLRHEVLRIELVHEFDDLLVALVSQEVSDLAVFHVVAGAATTRDRKAEATEKRRGLRVSEAARSDGAPAEGDLVV